MAKVIYFLSDADGRWELSDGDPKIGHIEQAGLGFVVQTTPDFSFGQNQREFFCL